MRVLQVRSFVSLQSRDQEAVNMLNKGYMVSTVMLRYHWQSRAIKAACPGASISIAGRKKEKIQWHGTAGVNQVFLLMASNSFRRFSWLKAWMMQEKSLRALWQFEKNYLARLWSFQWWPLEIFAVEINQKNNQRKEKSTISPGQTNV